MSQRLKNIVQFIGIVPNTPTSLPHGLRDPLGNPLTPDVLTPSVEGFTVTADDLNVTVVGNGTHINVLCEAWHSFERSFGTEPTGPFEHLLPQPFVPFGQGGEGADAFQIFVFRPGGVAGDNIFTDWNSLYAALSQTTGFRLIQFDNTLVQPVSCVIPPGVWDMKDVEWFGFVSPTSIASSAVDISNGASLPNLRAIGTGLQVNNLNTLVAPIVIPSSGAVMSLGLTTVTGAFPIINNVGGAPFIDASALTGGAFLILRLECRIAGTAPAINLGAAPAGLRLILTARYATEFRSGHIVGTDPGQIIFVQLSTNAAVAQQPGFAGTISHGSQGGGPGNIGMGFLRWPYFPSPPAGPSTVPFTSATGLGMQSMLRFDTTAGNVAQTLPKIKSAALTIGDSPLGQAAVTAGTMDSTGMTTIIKNETGANNVSVTPAAGDTIQGGAGPFLVPAGGARTFMSDGKSNWIIVGGYL